jgi:mannose-1-phosphate guanylyltransferase
MADTFAAVIMAGGSGQRFWPLSTAEKPKQFLDLEHCGRTLLQATYDRVLPLAGDDAHIFVITGERYASLIREQLPSLPSDNLLLEPIARDTAPAMAFAALKLKARLGNPVMGIFPSDHRVGKPVSFQHTLQEATELAAMTKGIVTLGMKPDRPATGYGYIERGEGVSDSTGYKVARFVEKPNLAKAQEYLATGNFSWNGGIFVCHVATLLEELKTFMPDLLGPLTTAHREGRVAEVFPTLPKLSIDYGVLEKTERAYMVDADFDWDDVGDWQALERLLHTDANANTVIGHYVGLEGSGNIIYTEDDDSVIVTLGLSDIVAVKRGKATLLIRKDRVQDIKTLLQDERLVNFAVT